MYSVSYLIAGADVHSTFQIFQNFVDVPCPCRSQETGVAVWLQEAQKDKHVKHKMFKPHLYYAMVTK